MVVNCEHVWSEVSDYLDSELDPSQRAAMDDHLRGCEKCRSVLEGTRNIVQLYGDERLVQLPLGFSGRLQKALARSFAPKRIYGRAWVMAVAAMVLVVGSIALAGHGESSRAEPKSELANPLGNVPPQLEVVVVAGGKIFHLSSCTFIHEKGREVRSLTAREAAKEGYVPCVYCLAEYIVRGAERLKQRWLAA